MDRLGCDLSVTNQCSLLDLPRSSAYYEPHEQPLDQTILNALDELYTKYPFYGKRRMVIALNQMGYAVGIKLVRTMMRTLSLEAIYPEPKTSIPNPDHKIYPYLLRNIPILRPNHVWSTDITYIRLHSGWIYLVAIIDWYSRYIVSYRVSISMEKEFCIEALKESLTMAIPDFFNSDQGSQFTSLDFTNVLSEKDIAISMDGKGRCLDNIYIERFWRSVKYEEVYLKDYTTVTEAKTSLDTYIHFYNNIRPHQSLNYKTPAEIYFQKTSLAFG